MGAWLSYGLGSENQDLPAFIVLVSAGQGGQPLYARLWGSGFLDSRHQGVQFRAGKDPVLYLSDPDGICRSGRRAMLDKLGELNRHAYTQELDPEIESRIAQYEMAYRMQVSVPDTTDLSDEPEEVFELYGQDAKRPGTFAANCLLARRLAEQGVRHIQLYHQGWDQHDNLPGAIRGQCAETDQPSAALIKDLKRRGMLDETLVVWGGEFETHVLLPGHTHCQQLRPRPPPPLLQHLDGGRWDQARPRPRPHRTSTVITRSTAASTSTTSTPPSCTSWASTTNA